MKLAIFGTSNGIISDGYLAALKAVQGVETIINLSLGASPIDFFAYRFANVSANAADFAILESAVNDALSPGEGRSRSVVGDHLTGVDEGLSCCTVSTGGRSQLASSAAAPSSSVTEVARRLMASLPAAWPDRHPAGRSAGTAVPRHA